MEKITISLLLFVLLLFQFELVNSQTDSTKQTAFSLQQAQDYALKNNAEVKNASLDAIIAKKKVWETTAIGLPQANGSIAYQNIFNVPVMPFQYMYPIYDNNGQLIDIGSGSNNVALGVKENITYELTVSQLVFSGEYLVGLQASKTYKMLSEQSLKSKEIDIKETVASTYYTVLVVEENKKILSATLENLNKTTNEVEKMFQAGFTEDTDLDQIKLTTANIKNALTSVERQLDLVYKLLKFQMGISIEQPISLTDNVDKIVAEAQFESLSGQRFEIKSNITYQLLETQEKLSELNWKRQKSTVLPSIAAFYRHQEQQDKPAFNFNPPDVIGVTMNIPIFASGSRYVKMSQAKLELEKTRNFKTQATQGLLMQYDQANVELKSALDKYLTEKNNMELSKRIYDKTLAKYKEGISSSLDLTQANTQYLTTQSNYFNSLLSLLNAKTKLEKLLTKN